jgi:ascorbate-specific PTS system EIIC-type component UlaA
MADLMATMLTSATIPHPPAVTLVHCAACFPWYSNNRVTFGLIQNSVVKFYILPIMNFNITSEEEEEEE